MMKDFTSITAVESKKLQDSFNNLTTRVKNVCFHGQNIPFSFSTVSACHLLLNPEPVLAAILQKLKPKNMDLNPLQVLRLLYLLKPPLTQLPTSEMLSFLFSGSHELVLVQPNE